MLFNLQKDPGENHPIQNQTLTDNLHARYNELIKQRAKTLKRTAFRKLEIRNNNFLVGKEFVQTGWC